MTGPSAFQIAQKADAAWQAGHSDEARELISDGIAQYPDDAELQNAAGDLFQRMGDFAAAQTRFAKAVTLNPHSMDFAINHAIALNAGASHQAAIDALVPHQATGMKSALFCSTMGTSQRGAGRAAQAALWYDRALSAQPGRPKALHGRARVALERGEHDALARFDTALSVNQTDPDLWLGKAQSLDVAGHVSEARSIAEQLVAQAPHWGEGLRFLAQLRLAAGEQDFTAHYEDAAKKIPNDPNIYIEWSDILSGLDFNSQAAEVAAKGAAAFPDLENFRLLEANYAGAAGDIERAETLFGLLSSEYPTRNLHEARHRIRRGEYENAGRLLEMAMESDPWNIAAWALRGIVWRLTDNTRAEWLHEQAGLVQLMPLADHNDRAGNIINNVIPLLHQLHDNSPLPLGQSLRGGSQTRGHLFDRTEPEIAALEGAIRATIEQFRLSLPAQDSTHPLLRHRKRDWTLAGSWSVRLIGGGDYHTSHIHPQGVVSSALYLEVPCANTENPTEGWLEIGRPPPDLQIKLEPLRIIEPKAGHLALFPSTLYHGTRPFLSSRRMTVAFDVITMNSIS